jgi:eukaryotic-like serine/threonine-protein kinase
MVAELQPGDPRKVGPYWLLGRLGSGGMGRVFLARSPGGRHVAVKVVRAELAEQADFRARFAREVAAAQTVSGLFTAPVVDADLDGPVPWLATAYVAGPSLADAVTGHGPLPVTSVLALAAGLAEGLGAIHAAGIVHRDLKPSNVLLADDGPRIIDFGISRAAEASVLTSTGLVVGSPGFMSPEQAEGRDIGPPSDVFSLGAVLTFAATGEGPFGTGSTATLAYRVVHTPPAIDDLPAGLRPLVERCLAKDPEKRHTTNQLLTALDTAHPAAGWLPAPIAQAFPLHAPPDPATEGAAAAGGPPARSATELAAAPRPPPPPGAPGGPPTVTAASARNSDADVAQPQPGGGRRKTIVAGTAMAAVVVLLSVLIAVLATRHSSATVSSASPTTADPTIAPTTANPTIAPTTANPTIAPTTANPTIAPTTANPTIARSPLDQLTTIANQDQSAVQGLAETAWVPILGSKQVGTVDPNDAEFPNQAYTNDMILQNFNYWHSRYPSALLLQSNSYSSLVPGYWVIIVNQANSASSDVISWCMAQRLSDNDCDAALLSNQLPRGPQTYRGW